MRARIALLVLVTLLLATPAPAEAPRFPILGWWGPPVTPGNLQVYKDGGFNTLLIPAVTGLEDALDTACAAGLSVYVVGPQRLGQSPSQWEAALTDRECVDGAVLHERATAATEGQLTSLIRKVKDRFPGLRPIASLVPPSEEPEWPEMASRLAEAGMPAVLCHSLPFLETGATDEAVFFANIREAQAVTGAQGCELWGMVQTTAHGPFRSASESDMRFQAYSYLAAGARGLAYYTYWGPAEDERTAADAPYAGWGRPMVRPETGEPLYGWLKARDLNAEIQTLAPYLADLEPRGRYFVGDVPQGCRELPREGLAIREIQAERALAAFFTDADGTDWALLINRRHGPKRSAIGQKTTLRVFVAPGIGHAVEIDRYNGYEKRIPLQNGAFLITIPGGTGSLLRFER